MLMIELLSKLVAVSEKSAELARVIRSENALFKLLIEEKVGHSKNKRFVQDFKTLADVLVQEMVKHDIGKKYPEVIEYIYGEESNKFTNGVGETIEVTIQEDVACTTQLLAKVLGDDRAAASLLAETIHHPFTEQKPEQLCSSHVDLSISDDIAIWIDPIDSTAQYIAGINCESPKTGVYEEGLQCVVVLIGVYNRHTGVPIMGIINQPFCLKDPDTKRWSGRCIWGFSYNGVNVNSIPAVKPAPTKSLPETSVLMSTSESINVQDHLDSHFTLVYAAGAGYKILCVTDKLVGCYLLSKGSTFKWDTCAPQAILMSQLGGLVDFDKALHLVKSKVVSSDEELAKKLSECQVLYHKPDNEDIGEGELWSNGGGVIAYRDPQLVISVLKKLV